MLFNKLALMLFGIVAVAVALPTTNDVVKRADDSVPDRRGCDGIVGE